MEVSYLARLFTALDVLPGEPGDIYTREESTKQYFSYDSELMIISSLATGDEALFKKLCLQTYAVGKTSDKRNEIVVANMHAFFAIAARVFIEYGMPRTEAFFYHDQITAIILKDPVQIDFPAIEAILFQEIARMREIHLACKSNDPNVIAAIDYIGKNLHRTIRLEDIAAYVGLSRSRLSTVFKKTMNESMFAYIRRLRIKEAKALLTTAKMSTAQVSYTLQFASESYFCACFKKEVGMTPSEYRRHVSGFFLNFPGSNQSEADADPAEAS